MPRHPPCALKHLLTHKAKKEITHFDKHVSHEGLRVHLDARNHYPILKHHTPPPRWRDSTRIDRVLSQGPIVCLAIICCYAPGLRPLQTRTPHGSHPTNWSAFVVLLRKEVIQPHLPVRLPCYDFVPIADPTFDSSLPRVRPLASGVTDFHDVTGGVYKARERIHRSVADLRLLATPTSWGRVADPNPN